MKVKYVRGDATKPQTNTENAVIVHCCNDLGAWGSGFVLALNKAFGDGPRVEYMRMVQSLKRAGDPLLGAICFADLPDTESPHIWVCNLIGQRGVVGPDNPVPVKYSAIARGYATLAIEAEAFSSKPSIHMPRMGCGLAGGKWEKVEELIHKELKDFDVTVYDL